MNDTTEQDLYNALVATFTLMAFADHTVHLSETSVFIKTVNQSLIFGKTPAELMNDIEKTLGLFKGNYEKVQKSTLEIVSRIKSNPSHVQKIMKMAQRILISDGKILEAEEETLGRICDILGVPKTSFLTPKDTA